MCYKFGEVGRGQIESLKAETDTCKKCVKCLGSVTESRLKSREPVWNEKGRELQLLSSWYVQVTVVCA